MSSTISENNKRIAKNTLLLYFRLFITMAIGLYTSRVILNVLGVSDYGIYNVVGGIITMLTFLNAGMIQSSQRFISYELGREDTERLNVIFSMSINIHASIAVISFLLAETVGLWFINNCLNIDAGRMIAANWVYQCSIFTFLVSVMSVPYNSCIVAHERMSAFAYISILEVVFKLLIVYVLWVLSSDKLIVYAILVFLVSIVIRLCYTVYCKRNFVECHYHYCFDKTLFREMFSFAGWSVVGSMGFSFKDQASNIILNLFYGTTLNAARGIGIQVSALINTFSSNFSMALTPQITKQYAVGNEVESRKLVYAGSRYTFYLLTFISLPVIVNVNYVLKLWLGIVPDYTANFLVLSLLSALLYALSGTVTTAIQATGKVKAFQMGISLLMLSELPMAYLLLKLGYPPYSVMYPTLFTYTVAIFFRFYLIKQLIPAYDYKYYIGHVLLRCVIIFVICYFLSRVIRNFFQENILALLITSVISLVITAFFIFFFGLSSKERKLVITGFKTIRDKMKLFMYR